MAGGLVVGDVFRHGARAVPRRTAAALGEAAITFAELDRAANRHAAFLSRQGISRGRRVALWSATSLEVVPVFAALAKLGAPCAPLSPLWGPDELDPVLAQLRPALLVVDDERRPLAGAAALPAGTAVLSLRELAAGAAGEDDGEVGAVVDELDTHVVFYTSGSSGAPKGVVLSHRTSVLRTLAGALPERRGTMVCPYPLFHMGAWTIALQQWQARDAVVLVERGDAGEILAAVARHGATRLNCVPAVWARILRAEAGSAPGPGPLASLRFADTGTSATPVEFLRRLAAGCPGAQVRVFYGSTEAGCVSVLGHDDIERRPGSCGVPGPLTDVRVDGDGRLWVRGPLLFDGYLDDPGASAAALFDGWYDTGDLAEVDGDGFLSIVGRVREVIRTGGESVAPAEVEAVLGEHPGVGEVAVVGLPDLDDLRALCAGRLAPFKHPRRLAVLERLPRTAATGQVQRRLLVEQLG